MIALQRGDGDIRGVARDSALPILGNAKSKVLDGPCKALFATDPSPGRKGQGDGVLRS
jgi:hypothetical protein